MEPRARIIYLDNSHLHLLSEIRQNDAPRFTKFMEVWNSQKCALALSQIHLYEITRYKNQGKKEARFDLLEELLPIHSDLSFTDGLPDNFRPLANREIFNALIQRGVMSVQDQTLLQYAAGLPAQLTSKNHIAILRQLENTNLYRNIIEAFYEANRVSAAANSRPSGTKYERPRLSRMEDARIDSDDVAKLLQQLEQDQIDVAQLESLRGLLTPEMADDVYGAIRREIEEFVLRAGEAGSASALAEFLGIDPADGVRLHKPLDLLIQQYTFEFTVRHFLTDVFGSLDGHLLDKVAAGINLEDCPGTWLKHAVQIQMRKAVTEDTPSNYYDLEHLAYLPYVDILFADKRILAFTQQVFGSNQLPPSLNGVREPVAVPNSVNALESAITLKT